MEGYPKFEDFQDHNGKQIRFKYIYLDAGNIFSLRALEDAGKEVYREFSSYDYNSQSNNLYKIRQIIKRELNTRYFSERNYEEFGEMNFDHFKGNITTDEQDELCIVVDGKKMSMDALKRVIRPHQGFEIEIKISED
ncbi:MAG: DUF7713 domain-containing protein, partial [Candidatus Heimdallarchaeaceae archaeon]